MDKVSAGDGPLDHHGSMPGMRQGTQKSASSTFAALLRDDGPIPLMPGTLLGERGKRPSEDVAPLFADISSALADERSPIPSPREQNRSGSDLLALIRHIFIPREREQKPDRDLRSSFSLIWSQFKVRYGLFPPVESSMTADTVARREDSQSFFALMDAPLQGMSPDDIEFAGELDAALTRRPRFGARVLSISVAVMLFCLLVWAGFAEIDEVTHAEGTVVGSQRTQTIQNLEGGILQAILVHENHIVNKGDVLALLDNEFAESAYRDAMNKAMKNSMAILRLEAELREDRPAFPQDLPGWGRSLIGHGLETETLARLRQIVQDEENAWVSRRQQLATDIEVLRSQEAQRRHEVEEQSARKVQLDRSLAIALEQQETARKLVQRNNFSRMEYLNLQQKVVELQGQVDMLAASIPKTQAAAAEAVQRIAQRQAEQKRAVTEEINKLRVELTSLHETLSAGSDRVTRTELRAPVRGTVKQIHINTVGGVVKPGEPIMDLVPLDDTLLVEAKVMPKDVAFLRPGQDVTIKVSAYDFSIYGGLQGKLEHISADTIEDKQGDHYYLAKIRTSETAIDHQGEILPIIPGMLVVADILIGKKTVLDYILKPILRVRENALRER